MTAPTHMPDTGQVVVATRKDGSGLTGAALEVPALSAAQWGALKVVGSLLGSRPTRQHAANCAGLMRWGLVERAPVDGRWCWQLTDAGRAALAASEAHDTGGNDG